MKNTLFNAAMSILLLMPCHVFAQQTLAFEDTTVVQPSFPGGEEAMYRALYPLIRYPAMARENQVQGIVIVDYLVDESGVLQDIRVVEGIGSGCDEAAISALRSLNGKKR